MYERQVAELDRVLAAIEREREGAVADLARFVQRLRQQSDAQLVRGVLL
jgi:hypothetical protein